MPALRPTLTGLLLALSVSLSVTLPGAAAAAAPPTPSPRVSTTSAAALDQQVDRQKAELAAQSARLQAAGEAARDALQERQQAERAAGLAARQAADAQAELLSARAKLDRSRDSLDGFAGALYRDGAAGQQMSYLKAALRSGDPSRLLHDVELAEQVGEGRGQIYEEFRDAAVAQRAAAQRAQQAEERATRLRGEAEKASELAQAAVAEQTELVAARRAALMETIDAAADAHHREALLAKAEQIALERSRAAVPASALAGALVPRPYATCTGGDLAGYPNGTLPETALCPLWGTSGQVLRADAAAAFNALSRLYAEEHGEPLCVTDSYRNLSEQIAVRAAKPTLAAVPGTSNHGWGVALDLCGGVERFHTPAHAWLLAHAAEFGWFHPSWAGLRGSKPEAWHWEFAG